VICNEATDSLCSDWGNRLRQDMACMCIGPTSRQTGIFRALRPYSSPAGEVARGPWHACLDEPTLADAILDRIVHGSHKMALKGESMRKLAKAPQLAHSMANADSWDRIATVIQDTSAGCPPSHGTLSAINGMRTLSAGSTCAWCAVASEAACW